MSDKNDNSTPKKPLKLSAKLDLKNIMGSERGRSAGGGRKTVVVEVKKRTKTARPSTPVGRPMVTKEEAPRPASQQGATHASETQETKAPGTTTSSKRQYSYP